LKWLAPSFLLMATTFIVSSDGDPPWFKDVAREAGVFHPHQNRSFDNEYAEIMEGYTALGAAVAVADFNNNGFEDIFVTDSHETGRNRLYRNNGDFTFTEIAEEAGVASGNDSNNASSGALWFDYDGDGWLDLFVIRFGTSQLFKNLGDGTFREVTKEAGLDKHMNAIAAVAFDYDLDGDLDLFIGCYFQPVNLFQPDTPRFFPESFEYANNGGGVVVFRNNGNGTFTEVTKEIGFDLSGWTLDLGHGDANNNGYDDLYIACDFGTDRFFVNNGDGTFSDITESAIGFDTKKGMNVDWGDFDRDGYLDIYVTNITDEYMREGNFLWRNNGDLTFTDVAWETNTFDTGWGWAGKFFDFDHDGWLDLYVVNGWVSAGEENYVLDIFQVITSPDVDLADARNWPPMGDKTLSGYQKSRLFRNQQGALFTEEAARHGLDSIKDGRGIAVADFDNDGRLDLFVTNANSEPHLYRNLLPLTAERNWVAFQLQGTKSNRWAIGAQVRVRAGDEKFLGFVNGGNGFSSQSSLRVHFGLGSADRLDEVEIRWPSGKRETIRDVEANRMYRIVEGEGRVRPFKARR
jgi:enediyne biosynthesis protein E4